MLMTSVFRIGQDKWKYVNGKLAHNFLFDDSSNISYTFHISKIFAVEMCMTLTLTLKYTKVNRKSVDRKPVNDFVTDGDSNLFNIFHHLQDIHYRYMHDLDLDL